MNWSLSLACFKLSRIGGVRHSTQVNANILLNCSVREDSNQSSVTAQMQCGSDSECHG